MKSFAQFLAKLGTTLLVGLFLAFAIQTAWAVTGPDCDPSAPSSSCTVIPQFTALLVGSGTLPSANDLKVDGNATVVGTTFTDTLESVSGNPIYTTSGIEAENSFVSTNLLKDYVGGIIDVYSTLQFRYPSSYIDVPKIQNAQGVTLKFGNVAVGPGFGYYYYKRDWCGTGYASCLFTGGGALVGSTYYLQTSCNAGDILVNCSGYGSYSINNASSMYVGSRIVKVGANFVCEARGKDNNLSTSVVCLSPDAYQLNTNY